MSHQTTTNQRVGKKRCDTVTKVSSTKAARDMFNMRSSADIPSALTDQKCNTAAKCVASKKITRASHTRNPRRWVNEFRRRSTASKDADTQADARNKQYHKI
eukprot:7990982-Heterocapsa_arctica.AAC.1